MHTLVMFAYTHALSRYHAGRFRWSILTQWQSGYKVGHLLHRTLKFSNMSGSPTHHHVLRTLRADSLFFAH